MMQLTKKDLNKTLYAHPDDLVKKQPRYVVDANGLTLWRLATVIADYLLGKNQAYYCDWANTGWFVVVSNVSKIQVTGSKLQEKKYYRFSGYEGNLRTKTLAELNKADPTKALRFAVRGMLPKNTLRDRRMKKLKLFAQQVHKYDISKMTVISC